MTADATAARPEPTNPEIAAHLDETADLLEAQRANPFRVSAYRRAASTLRALPRPVAAIAADGVDALMGALGTGPRLARVIMEIVATGRLGLLDRLRGDTDPTAVLTTIPGIGPELAERVHQALGIETLEEIELAAHDGRLATVHGFGARRIRGVRESLGGRLGRTGRALHVAPSASVPPVAELLDVDREYREAAAAGRLRCIAPRRFNPQHRSWLPILHTERGDRHYTATFSNTWRAHQRGRTDDWVVIYCDDDDGGRQQATVVTETRGAMAGRRIVRGRERDCVPHYAGLASFGRPSLRVVESAGTRRASI